MEIGVQPASGGLTQAGGDVVLEGVPNHARPAPGSIGGYVTCCYLAGYHEPGEAGPATVLGMPSWVFWGVLVPWLGADLFGFWFCFFFMADDPLGESEDEAGETRSAPGSRSCWHKRRRAAPTRRW